MTVSDDYIREAAYYLWEKEGRPEGMDFDLWVRAKAAAAAKLKKGGASCGCDDSCPTEKKTAVKKTTAKKAAAKTTAKKK